MKYRGRLMTPEEFGEIVLLAQPDGTILHLKDVADIELGSESYAYKGYTNGHPGVSTMVFQTAGSNATQVVNEINALLEEVESELPKGVAIAHLQSVNDFLYASINEVIKTLIEAILLVILVVYVFLQDIRSTLIPTISILVALVGTFAFLSVAGFSINLLTLFALVLAIGTVVDDAIIVVEAVQARFDVGYKSSYMATIDAMSGITSAIITSTLVFMAVFIPVAMMGVGRILHAVRYHDGRGRRYLGDQRPYALPGPLRTAPQTVSRRERRNARQLRGTLPQGFQQRIQRHDQQIQARSTALHQAQMADVVHARTGVRRPCLTDEHHEDGSGARRGPRYDHGQRHDGSGHFARRNASGHGRGLRPHQGHSPDQGLHAGGRIRYDRRSGFVLRYVYHQAEGLGGTSRKNGCGKRGHRSDLRTHGRYQERADLRRGAADDFGLRHLDRLLHAPAG